MANSLYFWDGTTWQEIAAAGTAGGAVGPPGPPGDSIDVFGPQLSEPTGPAKGDVWLLAGLERVPLVKRVEYGRLSSSVTYRRAKYPILRKRRV
jgi:hypothetical protein